MQKQTAPPESAPFVVVTGGAGFIGSHTCKELARAGLQPVALDDLSRGNRTAVRWGPLERGDVRDESWLRAMLRKYRPVAVLHFAGLAYVHESFSRPGDYRSVNVGGTETLLAAMRQEGVARLVFSSSCATFGIPEGTTGQRRITESMPQKPINPYGETKLAAEKLILAEAARSSDFRYGILRYFNAAGADPNGEIGEDHEPETHILPRLLQAALGLTPTPTIFGDDFATPDGTAIRDYVHVTDLAEAHVLSLRKVLSGSSHAVNLGSGRGTSIRELIHAVERVTGRPLAPAIGDSHPGDPPELVCDPAMAESVLGWRARRSDLETIVRDAWTWIARHSLAR